MTEPDFHYTWPTRLRANPLLRECTPYNASGGFRASVEVVIFPKQGSTGYTVLTSSEYLKMGSNSDSDAAAIRFNTDTIVDVGSAHKQRADPFSVIWVPETGGGDYEAVGQVHLIGPSWITEIMREMVERSATSQVNVNTVLDLGERVSGHDTSSTLRPAPADTGLVKSVAIPPGRVRVVSRLENELLKHRKRLSHEVTIAATAPTARSDLDDLEIEIAVFPKGWVNMRSAQTGSARDLILLPVPTGWGRPREGRTGLGSRYFFERLVSQTRLGLASKPPPSRRPQSGRRGAEVRVRVLRRDVELCRLHHPFWIEPREKASGLSVLAEELQQLLELLSEADISRATKASADTVRAWVRDVAEPSSEEVERVNELLSVVGRLAAVMTADFIASWLRRPLPVLNYEKPLDVLGRGDFKDVSRVVAALESPVAS